MRARIEDGLRAIGRRLSALSPQRVTWRGATVGLVLGVSLLFAVHGGWMVEATSPDRGALITVLGFGVLIALFGPLLSALAWLGEWFVLRPVLSLPVGYRWAATSAVLATGFALAFGMRLRGTLLIVLLFVLGASLAGAGLASVLRGGGGWRRALGAGALLTGLALLGGQVAWLANDGPGQTARRPLATASAAATGELSNPGQAGAWGVRTLTYGSGRDPVRPEFGAEADLVTQPVDGSALVDGWGPGPRTLALLPARLRTRYFGTDARRMPLAARVWYPEREEPSPLVLMVHGNHLMHEASDGGYDYLGELLASRGFIFVSVDANFLNRDAIGLVVRFLGPLARRLRGLSSVHDARAWLLLEHLRVWHTWNAEERGPFAGRVDTSRIALVGHSAGGEAVALAALFNRLGAHPDQAVLRFDYDFDIRAVVAFAPVDGRHRPAGVLATPEGIDYLTLHGSHDSDVQSFEGARMYQRIRLPPVGPGGERRFKSAVYVGGANHGRWNRAWGARDWGFLPGRTLNVRALLEADAQETVARVFLGAFLEATLHEREAYRELFQGPGAAADWLPETVFVKRYSQSGDRLLATFDEDPDPVTATVPGGTLSAHGLGVWREQPVAMKRGELGTNAVYLGWRRTGEDGSPPHFQLRLEEGTAEPTPGARLLFSLADARPAGAAPREPLDLTVQVFDADGDSAALPLGSFAPLEPQLAARLLKSDAVLVDGRSEPVLQDYALPLAAFAARAPGFDAARLEAVRFVFDLSAAGQVLLDDVGLRDAE